MKTIKQFDAFHPDKQLRKFFTEIHFAQAIYLIGIVGWTIVVSALKLSTSLSSQNISKTQSDQGIVQTYGTVPFLTVLSFSQFIILLFASLSDYKKEQQSKGSLALLISVLIRSHLVLLGHFFVNSTRMSAFLIIEGYSSVTSIPLQVLLMISISSAFENPKQIVYLFIKPFQIKSKFKPLLYLILLEIASLRFDLFLAIFVQFWLTFLKIDKKIAYLSRKIEKKIKIPKKLYLLGYLNVRNYQTELKELDIIKTNNSIVMEQK